MRRSGLGLALALVLCSCSAPPAPPVSAGPSAASPSASPSPADLLKQAREAASRGAWREAGSQARAALKQGQLKPEQELEAQDLILEMSLRIGDYRGAREQLAGLSPALQKQVAEEQLRQARLELDQKNYPDAILRARTVVELDPSAHQVLARAYAATNQPQLALEELRQLPGSQEQVKLLSEEIAQGSKARGEELARKHLALARKQAAEGQWGPAAVSASKASEMLTRLGGHPAERAEAEVIQAREAATRGEFKAAARFMSEAVGLDPRAEYRKRLTDYQEKDRQIVSREELSDLDSFDFPPTQKQSQETSGLYLLGSTPEDSVVGSRELVYTTKTSQFSSHSGPRMVMIHCEGPGRDYWNLTFTGPRHAKLEPGLYDKASSDDADAPSVDISGCERGAGHARGKFRVYEISYDSHHNVDRFAADFVVSADGHQPFFGKIRFHSHFR